MKIRNSVLEDIDIILQFYSAATDYQKVTPQFLGRFLIRSWLNMKSMRGANGKWWMVT